MTFEMTHAVSVLERTPGTLDAMLRGLPDQWTLANEGEDTFSPRDVVGHMLHGEETDWIPRVEIILNHGASVPFEPFDRFIFREAYAALSLDDLLSTFADRRAANLRRLKELDIGTEQLNLEGQHPNLGRVTLEQLLSTWVVHDLAHTRQIARVMSKQYRDAVGPWRQYLRVLDE